MPYIYHTFTIYCLFQYTAFYIFNYHCLAFLISVHCLPKAQYIAFQMLSTVRSLPSICSVHSLPYFSPMLRIWPSLFQYIVNPMLSTPSLFHSLPSICSVHSLTYFSPLYSLFQWIEFLFSEHSLRYFEYCTVPKNIKNKITNNTIF